jgi:hypothetical protein
MSRAVKWLIIGSTAAAALYLLLTGCLAGKPEYVSKVPHEYVKQLYETTVWDESAGFVSYGGYTILENRPFYYYEQNVPFCGGFSVAGIATAFSMADYDIPISSYMSQWGRLFGGMTPANAAVSLNSLNIAAFLNRANALSDEDRLQVLREEIDSGKPVMLLVSNGFRKDGTYSGLKSQQALYLHWITLWGYYADGFFVYDSAVGPELYRPVPIGNTERSNHEILRDWSRPFYLSPFLGNTYITIDVPLLEPDPL